MSFFYLWLFIQSEKDSTNLSKWLRKFGEIIFHQTIIILPFKVTSSISVMLHWMVFEWLRFCPHSSHENFKLDREIFLCWNIPCACQIQTISAPLHLPCQVAICFLFKQIKTLWVSPGGNMINAEITSCCCSLKHQSYFPSHFVRQYYARMYWKCACWTIIC